MREIHEEVCREGWNEGLGTFTQYYGGQELDASALLLPLIGFLPVNDPRMTSTIATIERELTEGGLIRRTRASGTIPEGAFLVCSCWMADCLNLQGRSEVAVAQFERVLAVRNDLGLLSEDTTCLDAILPAIFLRRLRIWAWSTAPSVFRGPSYSEAAVELCRPPA